MKTRLTIVLILINIFSNYFFAQTPESIKYLGQTPPGYTPKMFQLQVSNGMFAAERITISDDGKEIYFSELNAYPTTITRIKYYKYNNNKWNGPFNLFENFNSPAFAGNDSFLFFQTSNLEGWYSTKKDTVWNAPLRFTNSPIYLHYLQMVKSGKYYVSSNPDNSIGAADLCVLIINGSDTTVQSLGIPINTSKDNLDFFISRDESYIILVSTDRGGLGQGDLFISYHKSDGSWTNPKNLGSPINTSGYEWGPYITPDNQYLFFSRDPGQTDNLLFWVKLGNLIDSLRYTNFAPYVKSPAPDQTGTVGCQINYKVPDSTFIDDDGNEFLTYSAALSDGKPLPSWLHFDSTTKMFTGIPDEIKTYTIKLTATDNLNASSSCAFKLTTKTLTIDYLGQTPPGSIAVLFTPGASSQPNRLESAGVFSRDGKEFYFSVISSDWKTRNTYVRKFADGNWIEEELASFSSIAGGSTETFINKENNRIIFPSCDNTLTSDGLLKTDFWITERTGNGWSTPKKLGNTINDIEVQWHPTISDSGHIFFGSKGAVYIADHFNDTTYGSPVKLNDANINKPGSSNADPFIAPDESYIIFSSNRTGGLGNNDLYISYKKSDNTWSNAINLGSNINSPELEFSAYVTPDCKYLLFARDNTANSTRDLYWVNTNFIDSLKSLITDVVKENPHIIEEYNLSQNYPNPFNPSTVINYTIGTGLLSVIAHVELKVYDVLGKEIVVLVNEEKAPGYYEVSFDAGKYNLSSGVYFYRISAGEFISTRKFILMK